MIKPYLWLRHHRACRAVAGYPLYDVPRKAYEEEGALTEPQVHENFEYFMRVRHERLAFLRSRLARRFDLDIGLDGAGIIALEDWLEDYGGGLVTDEPDMYLIWGNYQPIWQGLRAGYNVAIDAAIFVGEFLIARRPHLHWTHLAYSIGRDGQYVESRLHRPFIGGFPMKSLASDPIYQAFGTIMTSLEQSKIGAKRYRAPRCGLVYDSRSALYLANVPEPKESEVFTFGDYSHEPL
jgi:hypothetical protein